MFSRLKEERGQALVLTTLIVMLLAVIGTGLVSVGARQKSFSATEVRLENAYFAANAGLTRALTTLEKANKHESVVEIIYLFDPSKPEYAIWTNFTGEYGKGKIESVTPSLSEEKRGDYNGDGDDNDYKYTFTIKSVGRYPKESIFYAAKTLSGKVYVYKLGGGGSWINLPPAIPLGLGAEPGNQQITLSWLANTEKDLGGYKIYRSESLEGTYTLIHTAGKVTSWVDTGLTNGTAYYYKISAYSLVGLESDQSLPAWATPFDPAPAAPTGLTATAGDQKVTLQWNANSEGDLAGYKIYRSLTEGGPYTLIYTAGKVTSWIDTGLTNGTTYYYKISAYDADGNESEQSLPAWATPKSTLHDYFSRGVWTNSFNANNATDIKSPVYCTGNITANNALRIGTDNSPRNIYANGSITFNNASRTKGNIYARGNIDIRNGSTVSDTIQALGNIALGNGNKVNGSVQTLGNIEITNGSQFNQLYANGYVQLGNGVKVNGEIKAGNNLTLINGNHVCDSVWTMSNLTLGNGCKVDGTAWVHGNYSIGNGCTVNGGIKYLDSMDQLVLDIPEVPPVPVPDLAYYETEAKKIEGHYFNGNKTLYLNNENWNGIYYINGDLTLTLTYSGGNKKYAGKSIVVASGKINIPNAKDIMPCDLNNDSLILIAGDTISFVNGNNVKAYLWAGNKIVMNNAVNIYGAVVSPIIEAINANLIEYTILPE